MPNFDNAISGRTVGDAFDVIRTAGGIPVGRTVVDAYLTVMPAGASNTETNFLFRKHITSTPAALEGVIGSQVNYTVTASGAQQAGAGVLLVDAIPTTLPAGTVLEFSGGAFAVLKEKALQGVTQLQILEIDSPIVDNETATYSTVVLTFKLKQAQTKLVVPKADHPYDIQVTFDNGDPFTIEDGTINLRPQRTIDL